MMSRPPVDMDTVADTSPGNKRLKIVFIMYNVVLWTTGLILLWFGVWLEAEFSRYISGPGSQIISYFLLAMGVILVLFNSVACFCALRGDPVILNLYGLVLGVVFVVELLLSVSMVALKRSLLGKFSGQKLSQGDTDIDMKLIQSTFRCCGVTRGYLDYTAEWLFVPRSCCLPELPRCHTSNEDHVFSRSCYREVEKFIDNNIGTMSLLAMCFAAVTLVGMICSLSWAKKMSYEDIRDSDEFQRRQPRSRSEYRYQETSR